jgi:DNA-binding Xre family transcriptional regulator
MNKTDLKNMLGLSPSTISKMTKGENVSLEIIKK